MEEIKISQEDLFKEYAQARLDYERSACNSGYGGAERRLGHADIYENILKDAGLWEPFKEWFQEHPEYHSDFDRLEAALQEEFPGHPMERDYEWNYGSIRIGLTPGKEEVGLRTVEKSMRWMRENSNEVGYITIDRVRGRIDAVVKEPSENGKKNLYKPDQCREKYPEIADAMDKMRQIWEKTFPDYALVSHISEKAGVDAEMEYAEKDEQGRTKKIVLQEGKVQIHIDLNAREVTLMDRKGNEVTDYDRHIFYPSTDPVFEAARDEMGIAREEPVSYHINIHPQTIIDSATAKYAGRNSHFPQPISMNYEFNENGQCVINVSFGQNAGNAQFRLEDGTVSYYKGDFEEGDSLGDPCTWGSIQLYAHGMSNCIKSAICEHCNTRDENIKAVYDRAIAVAGQVKEHNLYTEPFVRFNSDQHMELVMETRLPGWQHGAVCADMETGEVWAEKDGKILSEFNRIVVYPKLDEVFNSTMDAIIHKEDRGNELENGLGMEEQEQGCEDREEDADIAD